MGRGRTPKFKEPAILNAIRGSRGIITVIAGRLACEWETAQKYISGKHSTKAIKLAYAAECEVICDFAESIIHNKIQAIFKQQKEHPEKPLSIPDDLARWILTRKGKDRGYAERQEITGANGSVIESHVVILPAKMKEKPDAGPINNTATGTTEDLPAK